jgi:hypothetical protein
LCSDEVNRPLEESLYGYFGSHFTLGGLAGFPFGGLSGFMAMTSHIPDHGSCLVVYGPHVGISADGQIGQLQRRGQRQLGTCCGSAIAAARYATAVYRGDAAPVRSTVVTALDAQQSYVASSLLPYAAQIDQALDPMVELPYALFQPMDDMMLQIISRADVDSNTRIAMLGVSVLLFLSSSWSSHSPFVFFLSGYPNQYSSRSFRLFSSSTIRCARQSGKYH